MRVVIEPSEMWEYFQKHKKELASEIHIVAENKDYGISIELTEERGMPLFTVLADGYQCAEESAVSADDCEKIALELYDKYLTTRFLAAEEEECEESALNQEDMISERETELDEAIMSLLDTIVEDDTALFLQSQGIEVDVCCEDLKDHILEYLAREYGIEQIRRPMVLEDVVTKEDFFTEYPYKCMVYEG